MPSRSTPLTFRRVVAGRSLRSSLRSRVAVMLELKKMLPAILALLVAAVPAEDSMITTTVLHNERLVQFERNVGFPRSDVMKSEKSSCVPQMDEASETILRYDGTAADDSWYEMYSKADCKGAAVGPKVGLSYSAPRGTFWLTTTRGASNSSGWQHRHRPYVLRSDVLDALLRETRATAYRKISVLQVVEDPPLASPPSGVATNEKAPLFREEEVFLRAGAARAARPRVVEAEERPLRRVHAARARLELSGRDADVLAAAVVLRWDDQGWRRVGYATEVDQRGAALCPNVTDLRDSLLLQLNARSQGPVCGASLAAALGCFGVDGRPDARPADDTQRRAPPERAAAGAAAPHESLRRSHPVLSVHLQASTRRCRRRRSRRHVRPVLWATTVQW